jgi:hypothetical protein
MGSRQSQFKTGGGFLNGVDGVITGYKFTDEFNGREFDPKSGAFHSLYCAVSVRVDGAEEDVTQHLFAGGADDYEISDDGLTLTDPAGGSCRIGGKTGAALFFGSFMEVGKCEDSFSDDEAIVNFEPAIGARVRFVQRKNAEATAKKGQRVDKKTGKKYDRTDLVIDTVYELATEAPAPVKGKATKPVAKATKAPALDLDAICGQAVVEIVTRLGKPTGVKQFSMESLKSDVLKSAEAKPHATAIRKRIMEPEFLTALSDGDSVEYAGVEYNVGFNANKALVTVTEA